MISYPIDLQIDSDEISDKSNKQVEKMFNRHLNIKLIKDVKDWDGPVCFNYALDNNDIGGCDDAHELLECNYVPIPIEEARSGDIVAYYYNEVSEYSSKHFGIIDITNGTIDGTVILSKWGSWGVYKTDLKALPECYGNKIVIWRLKEGR